MPFGTKTVNSVNYEPRTPGIYVKSTLSFSDPKNEFRVRGATVNKNKQRTANVTRVIQKRDVDGSIRQLVVTTSLLVDEVGGLFSAAEVDSAVNDTAEFLDPTTTSRIMMGES